jgi:hypothetical protein
MHNMAQAKKKPAEQAAKKTSSTIMDIWTKSPGKKQQEDLDSNLEMLQADAEQVLTRNKRAVSAAKRRANTSMESASTASNPDFMSIANAQLEIKEAELVRDQAIDTYVAMFGCNPMISVK